MTRRSIAILLLSAAVAARSLAQQPTSAPTTAPSGAPKLSVIIMVDQFRPDYLLRFKDYFVEGGFTRIISGGASFTQCHYDHGVTRTGPGHATVATGSNPSIHGIVGNEWMYVSNDQLVKTHCSADPATEVVGQVSLVGGYGVSPKWLLGETLGDALKRTHKNALVVACSLKDSPATFSAGRKGDAMYYWSKDTGNFVTSSFYRPEPHDWVQKFNAERVVDVYFQKKWTRVLEQKTPYEQLCRPDDSPFENGRRFGRRNKFPHALSRYGAIKPSAYYYTSIYASPFGNVVLLEFAQRAISELKLGQDSTPDLLIVSLSSNDVVGHIFGPRSHEVMDTTIRTDRQLAGFLSFLDETVGTGAYTIALCSDHGATMIPEFAMKQGIGGGRFKPRELQETFETALTRKFGRLTGENTYVSKVILPWLFLNPQGQARQVDYVRGTPKYHCRCCQRTRRYRSSICSRRHRQQLLRL